MSTLHNSEKRALELAQGENGQEPEITNISYTDHEVEAMVKVFRKRSQSVSVGVLGSCQYSNAWHLKELISNLHALGGWALVEKTLGIKIQLEKLPLVKAEIQDNFNVWFANFCKDNLENVLGDSDAETVEEYNLWYNQTAENLQEAHFKLNTALSAYIEYTRESAWDLWSASIPPVPWEQVEEPKVSVLTFGPLFNQLAQSENFAVGINIALWEIEFEFTASDWEGYDT